VTQSEIPDHLSKWFNEPFNYSVIFIAPAGSQSVSLGSGTLVSFGNVRGILTCRHVIELGLKSLSAVEVMSVTNNSKQNRPRRITVNPDQAVRIGPGLTKDAQDLAFLPLDLAAVGVLGAASSFVNGDLMGEDCQIGEPQFDHRIDCVYGTFEELNSKSKISQDRMRISGVVHRTQGAVTQVEMADDFDYAFFLPGNVGEHTQLPERFNGTSGGGLWSFYIRGDSEHVSRRLVGVAFYQTDELPSRIKCHGPKSIYKMLKTKIFAKSAMPSIHGS
jgi:hypothetical protein